MMMLELENLYKNFTQAGTTIEVLKGVHCSVAEGETLAILGQSGSGKSTLLSLLAGLDQPTSGQVRIAGQNIGDMDENQITQFRAQNIGIIFQQFHLMSHLSALENVMLPLEIFRRSSARKQAEEALDRVGLSHRMTHYPSQLSGGECQRVAIARAMVVEPRLLLADEPSGNLDVSTGSEITNLLFQLVKESHMTIILVTHNLELAKRCQRCVQLENGQFNDRQL